MRRSILLFVFIVSNKKESFAFDEFVLRFLFSSKFVTWLVFITNNRNDT